MSSGAKRKLTLAATAALTGKTPLEVAVDQGLQLGDLSGLVALFQRTAFQQRFTHKELEDFSRLWKGLEGEIKIRRGRGRPSPDKARKLGVIERKPAAERAADLVRHDLLQIKQPGERAPWGKRKELIKKYARACKANEWTVENILDRQPKKVARK